LSSRQLAGLVVIAATAFIIGCEDDPTVPPPPQPPQIKTVVYYEKTFDAGVGREVGLQDDDVFDMLVTTAGKLWIGNAGGIAIYPDLSSRKREAAVNHTTGMTNPKVRSMVEYNGKIYVGTWGGGLNVYDIAGDSWSAHRAQPGGLTHDAISDIQVYNDQLFIGTNHGVSIYDPGADSWTRFTGTNGLLDTLVSAVLVVDSPTRGEERWYMPRVEYGLQPIELPFHGVTLHKPGAITPVWKFTRINSGLVSNNVNDVFYEPSTELVWIAFSGAGLGVVDVDAGTWTYYSTQHGLPSNVVYSIAMAGNTMWVATQNGIARRITNERWQGYARNGGLRADRVRRVYSEDPSHLWLAFIGEGASRVDPSSAK